MASMQQECAPTACPWVQTPLIESAALSQAAGCRIFLKLENLQPSGSFKSRGIGNYCQLMAKPAPQETHFYASSGGNAGLACVVAAKSLNHKATVVVPTTTKPIMIAKIMAAGADNVIQHGNSVGEADTYLKSEILPHAKNAVYVPPYDHPYIWQGHSSLIHELTHQTTTPPDAIICSVGGGGLLTGLIQGSDQAGANWSSVPILAVETQGAHALSASLKAQKLVTLPKITSLAASLGASTVAEKAFEYAQRPNVRSIVLSDAEACMGCWRLADDSLMLVEPACGVNVALCYDGRLGKALGKKITPETRVVIVLCGGSNVTLDMLEKWRKEYGHIEKGLPVNGEVPSSWTGPALARL
ncbi:tryptophan synthase beta subunit-like PLP-dependent enzyme [Venturia nashicola]|uniref:L-serine ammonia-lyase n=1 Tax=Venturia nashicola TaxID=86259 RepID=A0A4Z1PHE0_9PEZI|nr:tryptophan synthase beta subunit-like PLP-dependent enzyme [Venturia nashicola]TLD39023.1 tryptophan synthase beta subunit-like PLP-dependent enzyme [Venturia nashicola]